MRIPQRIRLAAPAACLHLAFSAVVAALVAWAVFAVWYPYPYREISGGRELFTLLMNAALALLSRRRRCVANRRRCQVER